jgi:hypothetical protein
LVSYCSRVIARLPTVIGTLALLLMAPVAGYTQSFSDVPADHAAYEAIEALKSIGVLTGYPDGTFKPAKLVNRAEAVKIITAPLLTQEQLSQAKDTVFSDVPVGSWYLPYVEWARQVFKIIDGPPAKTAFLGENPVILVEFLKMLELANEVDPLTSYQEVNLPLANDVTDVEQWYYPYMRYAFTASLLSVDEEGKIKPGKQLTRADTALLLYNFLLNKQGDRTQSLLAQAEQNIQVTLQAWDQGFIDEAQYASARALLTARGAHASKPDEPVTQGAVKTAEAFRSLVRGYTAGANKDYKEAERLAGEAWNLADEAVKRSGNLSPLAEQIKTIAKSLAESARDLQKNQPLAQ